MQLVNKGVAGIMASCYLQLLILCCWISRTVAQSVDSGSGDDELPWYLWFVLAIALAVAIVLIALATFYVLNVCKKIFRNSLDGTTYIRHQDTNTEDNDGRATQLIHLVGGTLHDDSQLLSLDNSREIPREKIKVLQQLGIGQFGPLYDAEVELQVNVKSRALIKVFQQGTSQDLVIFRQELESLMKLSHARVGQLFGIVSISPYYSVLELPVNGDLKTFLITAKNVGTQLTIHQLIAMATDIASGLSYLESMQYIHRDVAARNCVVSQNLGVKVTDYKVGRYLFRSEYAVQADGSLMPIRWMAPETLLENHFSVHSDVWSFGVLLWEIFTKGEYPYCELSDGEVVHGVCYEFQRLLQPVDGTEYIYQLMLLCWHSNPHQRPRMEYLHQQLETNILANSK